MRKRVNGVAIVNFTLLGMEVMVKTMIAGLLFIS
jgi:hypothetical protein